MRVCCVSFAAVLLVPYAAAFAQQPGRTLTTADYAHAERYMAYNVNGLVKHTLSGVQYLPDGRVFYRDGGADGTAFMLADPAKGTTAAAFDSAKVASAVRLPNGQAFDPRRLTVAEYTPDASGGGFTVKIGDVAVHCTSAAGECAGVAPKTPAQPVVPQKSRDNATTPQTPPAIPARPVGRRRGGGGGGNTSPDKKYAVFIRDYNLWLRTIATGEEKQLTTDGVKDYGYATDNAGWQHTDAAIATWSADSRKIATFQQDQRKTGEMYLVPVTFRHPKLEAWKYPLVGDQDVTMIERVVIDAESGVVTRLKMAPDQHRTMECDDISCDGDGKLSDVEFSADDKHLAFVSTGRDHKDEWVRVADTTTGEVREVYHDHSATYYGFQGKKNFKYLSASNEFLFESERSNYGQLYLYDMGTGKLKNVVTHGDGPVSDITYVDEKNRVLYFTATSKEKGEDPYFENFYRVNLDGTKQVLLTPEVATHQVTMASDGSSFVDAYSTVEMPTTTVVKDNMGKVLVSLGKRDITALQATGWKPPTPVTVKARDGKTDLYGFLWKPLTMDASMKYPIVDYVYPGPQGGSCGSRGFAAAERDNQALAELGFVVICIDGMGNPSRSKAFHDAHASTAAEMGDDTIPDQVAAVKELAGRFAWIDAERVGIWGHSGGGNATVSAMFHFPDFFKVGIAESGNHDNRDYEDDWDERWGGLETIDANGKSNYDVHANQNYAKNLKGHLLLAHGTMDDNVPPNNTLLVADALIKANKDFDLLLIPNVHHGYAEGAQYMMRRRWDYFVRYLAGDVPPVNYQMKSAEEAQRLMFAGGGPSDDDADDSF